MHQHSREPQQQDARKQAKGWSAIAYEPGRQRIRNKKDAVPNPRKYKQKTKPCRRQYKERSYPDVNTPVNHNRQCCCKDRRQGEIQKRDPQANIDAMLRKEKQNAPDSATPDKSARI